MSEKKTDTNLARYHQRMINIALERAARSFDIDRGYAVKVEDLQRRIRALKSNAR